MRLSVDKLGKVAITVEENYWSLEKDYDKLESLYSRFYLILNGISSGTIIGKIGSNEIVAVVGYLREQVEAVLGDRVQYAFQEEQGAPCTEPVSY